jgi:formamidopyrimidine-DNA glycosylase
MPELPEVEAARRRVEKAVRGRRILAAEAVHDPVVFRGITGHRFTAALLGRRVTAVGRHGKHLWLELDRRPWPAFHFGMTGSFAVYDEPAKRPRFWRLEMVFTGGVRLAFSDPRRFGRIRLLHDPATEPPIALLGADPLLDPPSARTLRAILERRRAPLKAVLLDQSVFAGVGNWVADEILYQARLSPLRPASSLAAAEVGRLRRALLSVMKRAVLVGADSDRFPRGWLFHERWGRTLGARTAGGEAIVHATVGGRTTAWVPSRQK